MCLLTLWGFGISCGLLPHSSDLLLESMLLHGVSAMLGFAPTRYHAPNRPTLAIGPTASSRAGLPTACADSLWDEEVEQIEFLRQMQQVARQVEELKAIARPARAISLAASSDGTVDGTSGEETADDTLWDEDIESFEHLQEMASWDRRVTELREVASKGSTRSAASAVLPTRPSGSASAHGRLGQPTMVVSELPLMEPAILMESARLQSTQLTHLDAAIPAPADGMASFFPSSLTIADLAPTQPTDPEDALTAPLRRTEGAAAEQDEPWQKKPWAKGAFAAAGLLSLFHGLLPSPNPNKL